MVRRGLRTPLTAIKGSAAAVLGATSPPDLADMRQFFQIIDEQVDCLCDLTADPLEVMRIETDQVSIAPQPANIADLAHQAAQASQRGGARKRIRVELAPELPQVAAESAQVVQVLRNLLKAASMLAPERSTITVAACHGDS